VWESADGTVYFTQIFVRLAPAPADGARLEGRRMGREVCLAAFAGTATFPN
jgi:hypothetical protein